jgi:hypothetical protein
MIINCFTFLAGSAEWCSPSSSLDWNSLSMPGIISITLFSGPIWQHDMTRALGHYTTE